MIDRPARRRRTVYGLLLLTAGLYLLAELRLNPTDRFFDYDETIYISQDSPTMTPAHWAAHRARGMAWLVAPLSANGASLPQIRLYLMILSATLLFLGFSLWIPLIGMAAPLAAVLYGGTWLALFYGAEAMPNHFTALFALIAVAAYARRRSGGGALWDGLAALAMAATALMRPTDASCLFAGLVCFEIFDWRARRGRRLIPFALGLTVGWAQWLWEAEARFGGVAERFREAGHLAGGLSFAVLAQLRAADGPVLGGDRYTTPACVFWWLGIFALSLYGGIRASRRREAAATALLTGMASTITYFFFIRSTQLGTWAPVISPRFLCPAYALLAIPAAVGCVELVRGNARQRRAIGGLVGIALSVVIAVWLAWQWNVASRIATQQYALRERYRMTAETIRHLRDGRPCVLISQFPEPQIRYSSGCREARRKPYVFRRPGGLADLKRPGAQRFVLVYPPPFPDEALAMRGWTVVRQRGAPRALLFVEPEPEATDAPARSSSPSALSPEGPHSARRTAGR